MKLGTPQTRTVLIAVTGLTPAVVTETIYALACEKIPTVPDHVVVLTTRGGCDRLRLQLLAEGQWNSFRRTIERKVGSKTTGSHPSSLGFGPAQDHIRIIPTPGPEAKDADDIRTPAGHAAAADFILRTVREFSEDDGTRIIFSVAGGRKTMGALLFSVATLLGRPGDRVTHVLVNEPYENPRHGFLYPGCLLGPDPLPKGAPAPRIELADVPFVPLRRLFARDLGGKISGYMDLVRRLNDKVAGLAEVASLTLDINAQTLAINDGLPLKVGPRAFCLMLAYAHLARTAPLPLIPFKNIADTAKLLPAIHSPADETIAWSQEARDLSREAHKSLSDLRTTLAKKYSLTMPQVDRIVPHRGRTSIALPPESIVIIT
jgi:CRISPR-associated protein (TIGR02584 family)